MSIVLDYPAAGKDANQLHDALVTAGLVPDLVQSDGATITLSFPDGTSEAAVAAVVAAHIPQTRYEPATRLARVRALRHRERVRGDYERAKTQAGAATTLAQLRDAVLTVLEARPK